MIEEPPVLTIHRRRNRPSAAQLEALRDRPLGFVVDAMGGQGALSHEIAPLAPGALSMRFCGVALTCDCGPADILALLAGLTEVEAGDVLVVATGGWRGCAAAGDRVTGMARNGGAVALVTDGLVRDFDGIVEVGLPVFCAGLTPNSPYGKGPGTVGAPVVIGGVSVSSGDVILGDRDGVVVVPFDRLDAVIAEVARVGELEAALDARVAEGLTAPPSIVDLVASDAVRRVG